MLTVERAWCGGLIWYLSLGEIRSGDVSLIAAWERLNRQLECRKESAAALANLSPFPVILPGRFG